MIVGHKKQREFLEKKSELNQLSHAYLFTGAKEIGKKTFAIEFAEFVGCKFPDLLIIESINSESSIKNKKDSLEIDIGQIRDAQKFLSYKSYNGGFKIVVVDNAERMNVGAQNCFLKTLEEPKGKTLLILISSKPDMLLPTIASRCQTLKFSKPKDLPANPERLKKEQVILKDLLSVINSDLSDKFKYVKSIDFDDHDLGEILEVMQKYFRNLLLVEAGVGNENGSASTPKKYPIQKLKNIINLIEDINNKLLFTNANPKLALEILLMET
jgi:DNA polymerase-3 subunit delta'